jgi:hypothetical protein
MLLNEFLKEHRKVQDYGRKLEEQQAMIARLQKQIERLSAGLQKVNAQLEVSKPGTANGVERSVKSGGDEVLEAGRANFE